MTALVPGVRDEDLPILTACVASDDRFEAAVREWEAQGPIDDIPHHHIRFLPFLYRKAERLGVQLRDHAIAKGVYTKTWYHHHVEHGEVLEVVKASGVSQNSLILKGHALHALVYANDPPTRPSADVDLLTRRANRVAAIRALLGSGLTRQKSTPLQPELWLQRSIGLRHGRGELDLHWGIFDYCPDPRLEDRLFDRAITIDLRGESFRTLCPTDHLLHTLLHGAPRNNTVGPARWVVDAFHLVTSGNIDWELFVEEVVRNGWRDPLYRQLVFLTEQFDCPIPQGVLTALSEAKGRWLARALVKRHGSTKLIWRAVSRLLFRDQVLFGQTLGLTWRSAYLVLLFPATFALFVWELIGAPMRRSHR